LQGGTLKSKQRRQYRLPIQPELSVDAPLGERFERIAYQLVAAMTEKLEEANLHQITEALKFVFEKMGQTEDGSEVDVYEKLARLMDRFAAEKSADQDISTTDES
jgi:hypothetical protein